MYLYRYIFIYGTPPKSLPFSWAKEVPCIYIYIYFDVLENLDFVLEGEEFDYKGRIEIANQRRGV